MTYLSYLMGANDITDSELEILGIKVLDRTESGSRMIEIPSESLASYKELVTKKLSKGFWNEIVGPNEIVFIFKFKDGQTEEHILTTDNESQIAKQCTEFNNEAPEKTANVYRYLAENDFYRDFMNNHYKELINR